MTTSAINSVISTYLAQSTNNLNGAANAGDSGGFGASAVKNVTNHFRKHVYNEFMQDVQQALQNIGVDATTGSSSNTSTNSDSVQDAMQTFLVDLHRVLAAQPQTSGSSATGNGNYSVSAALLNNYSGFSSNLQSLIGALNSGTAANSGVNGQLQTDFNNLVTAMDGSSAASAPTLQGFLQQLQMTTANLNPAQYISGSLLKTTA